MKDIARTSLVSAVGLEISDRQLRFIELEPRKQGDLSVRQYGEEGVAFDVLENGRVLNMGQATDAVKRLRERTACELIVFSSWGDERDQVWTELLMIGGFSQVMVVPRPHLLDHAMLSAEGDSVGILHFSSPEQAELLFDGAIVGVYAYPWEVDAILTMQDFTKDHNEEPLRLVGQLPEVVSDMPSLMNDYGLSAVLPNVWAQCFDVNRTIPPITHEDSFSYVVPIAAASYAARYIYDSEQEQHLSTSILARLVPTQAEEQDSTEEPEIQEELTKESSKPTGSLQDTMGEIASLTAEDPEDLELGTPVESGDMENETQTERPDSEAPTPQRSVWLQDVDEMIYRMMGNNKD